MSHIGEAQLQRDAAAALRAALAAGTLQSLRDATGLHGAAACTTLYQEACEARDRLEEARLAAATERKQAKKRRQKQARADAAAAAAADVAAAAGETADEVAGGASAGDEHAAGEVGPSGQQAAGYLANVAACEGTAVGGVDTGDETLPSNALVAAQAMGMADELERVLAIS